MLIFIINCCITDSSCGTVLFNFLIWCFYFLNMWYGIMFPSLPVSTLYGICALFWLLLVFNFPFITKCMLLKDMEVIVTMLTCLSAAVFGFILWTFPLLTSLLVQTAKKWFSFLHPPMSFQKPGTIMVGG